MLCPTANPNFKEVTLEFSKSENNVNMIIGGDIKYMKQSTIQQNTELMNLIGLETNIIPIGKYITHEETYVNDVHIDENHYYRILESVEMDLSETDISIKDYMKFSMILNTREKVGSYTHLGNLYFFTIPNLNDKYIFQRSLTDFYRYDVPFNSYDSELNSIISDSNNKVDLIIKRFSDFIKDNDDDTTTTTTTISTETTSETSDTSSTTATQNDDSTISTNINTNTNTDKDDDTTTATTSLEDNSGNYLSSTAIFVVLLIIYLV